MYGPPLLQQIGPTTIAENHEAVPVRGSRKNVANQLVALVLALDSRQQASMEQTPKGACDRGACSMDGRCGLGPEAEPVPSGCEVPDRLWGACIEHVGKVAVPFYNRRAFAREV